MRAYKYYLLPALTLLCGISPSVYGQMKASGTIKTVGPKNDGQMKATGTIKTVGAKSDGSDNLIPIDQDVKVGKLANGFTYYIRKNKEPKNRVVIYLANKVGSILETDDQQGLAHFVEHMSFNGTKNFPKNSLIDYLQRSGVSFGADLNAYTGFDETVYQLPLPSDNPEIVKNGIQIMRDWAQDVTFDTEEINKERGVIMEEKRQGKGAQERMQRRTFPLLLNNSRYALRIPIGIEKVLLGFKPETLRKYYQDWYRPNLQALIIVGDIDVKKMEQTIKEKFADLKNPVSEKQRVKYSVPLTGKNQFLTVTDKEMTSTVAQVVIKHKARQIKTEKDYRESLKSNLFNLMLNTRYTELSLKSDVPYLEGNAGIQDLLGGLDAFSASVAAKPNQLEKGFKAIWREVRRLQLYGFTQAELTTALKSLQSNMEASVAEKDKIQSEAYVKQYLQNFLNQTAAPEITKESALMGKLLPTITLTELNALAKEYIKETNRDIIIMAPEKDKAKLPDQAKVLSWMKSVSAEKLSPYSEMASTQLLLATSPVAGKIIKEEKDDQLGITTLTLSNGVKVLLKKTDFKNNQIDFTSFSNGGTSLYPDNEYQSATYAANLIASSGVGNYNASQLNKYLSDKKIAVSPYIRERNQGFAGSSTVKDLESALQLVYGYFVEPRKDKEIFNNTIIKAKDGLVNQSNDPNSIFGDTVSAVLGNYNFRRTGLTLEKINQINLDTAFKIYQERFSDASDLTFTFVGAIDEEKIKPLLAKYLGSLPSTNKKEEPKDLGVRVPKGKITKTIYKGKEQKATVVLFFSGDFNYSNENIIKMQAIKEALQIRLTERLREEESGVYSPSVALSGSKAEKNFRLVISFICDPKNVDRLISSSTDEVSKIRTEGPSQQNIDKYKAESLRQRETALGTNAFWLSYLNEQLLLKEPLNRVIEYNDVVNSITPDSIKETANKYINMDNIIKFILMPDKTK